MRLNYYLHRRKGVWYAELVDQATGKKLTARSTGVISKTPNVTPRLDKSRDAARDIAEEWHKNGIPAGRDKKDRHVETSGAALFTDFLRQFWDFEKSPYVAEKIAHGQRIGKNHCYDLANCIGGYYDNYFAGRFLSSITRQDIKNFSLSLTEKREKPEGYKGKFAEKLSAAYINKILIVGKTALTWAYREGLIPVDPTNGIMRFSGAPKKRGVLTPLEAELIFKNEWEDKRAFTASLVACTTGCRLGEVLAIRKSDIGENVLFINHSWNVRDKLKTPKNGEIRKVPLLPIVRDKLLELLSENPHTLTEDTAGTLDSVITIGSDGYRYIDGNKTDKVIDPFVFYGLLEDQPIDGKFLLNGLHEACKAAGIDSRARGICFHSWRHFYAARMADSMKAEQIMRITGQKTKAVFDVYQDHLTNENLETMGVAAAETFGKILPFPDRKGA